MKAREGTIINTVLRSVHTKNDNDINVHTSGRYRIYRRYITLLPKKVTIYATATGGRHGSNG